MTDAEIIQHLKADGERGKAILGYLDRRVSSAINSYVANHPTTDELRERVERIDRAAKAKIQDLELRHYAFVESTKARIDPTLLDGFALTDRAAVDAKIADLLRATSAARAAEARRLMATSTTPASSIVDDRPRVRAMSEREIVERIEADEGAFDRLVAEQLKPHRSSGL